MQRGSVHHTALIFPVYLFVCICCALRFSGEHEWRSHSPFFFFFFWLRGHTSCMKHRKQTFSKVTHGKDYYFLRILLNRNSQCLQEGHCSDREILQRSICLRHIADKKNEQQQRLKSGWSPLHSFRKRVEKITHENRMNSTLPEGSHFG